MQCSHLLHHQEDESDLKAEKSWSVVAIAFFQKFRLCQQSNLVPGFYDIQEHQTRGPTQALIHKASLDEVLKKSTSSLT